MPVAIISKAIKASALMIVIALAAGSGMLQAAASASAPTNLDIAYEQFVLPNGLRVVVHTDRKAPIVAVNLWYHVGSKDEPLGRTGFAHLFEHLMFNGSENHQGEFFEPFELVGATDMNGTTNQDRTNYFENVPTTALDMALWMESDRMGHLLGAIDQKTLDEQRGVVQNEKRQGENQPYGQVWEKLGQAMYPVGHPYHHSVIGSMNDLNAATLEDVKNWFRTWYGPNNAVLVLAGDIDVETARQKVTQYFGDIPATPTMAQPVVDVAKRSESSREVMYDNVPQTRIYRIWNVADVNSTDIEHLQLLSRVLGGSASSRLDRRLRHDEQLVDGISAGVSGSQLGSQFIIMAKVKQGVDAVRVEAIIDEELKRLLKQGPQQEELARAKTVFRAGFIRGAERVGGFGGKADVLAECAIYTGDPGCFRQSLATINSATAREIKAAANEWLSAGDHTLLVMPGERTALAEEPSVAPTAMNVLPADAQYQVLPNNVDRSQGVPMPDAFPELMFPELQRTTLSNGTQLILAQRNDVPVVQMSYEFEGGSAMDAFTGLAKNVYTSYSGESPMALGVASFTMAMLTEGASDYDALAFAERAEALGASLNAGASLDGSAASLSALKENLDDSIELFATMLQQPRFDQADLERVKSTWIAAIAQEKAQPNSMAMRVLPPLLYGQGHPYGVPFSGTGAENSIRALNKDDLLRYQQSWLRPEGATLVVVGDTTLAEIVPLLEKHFGQWASLNAEQQPQPKAELAVVARPAQPRVFLIDQPGAVQATIIAGELVPSSMDAQTIKFEVANTVLGGMFSSRLNMNLREDKHWAYGAYSFAPGALGQRPWMVFSPVQIDKTAEAMLEIQREISDYSNGKVPPSEAEVSKIQAAEIRGLPGAYETAAAVRSTISSIVRYGRSDDYVFDRKAEIEGLTQTQVAQAAQLLSTEALTWVVVGDLQQIEQPIRALGFGEVSILDADGKPIAP